MWTVWNIGAVTAMLAALGFSVILSVPLSLAAYRLPRSLDKTIPSEPAVTHRYCRIGLYITAAILAVLCVWRFGPTPATAAAVVYTVVLLTLAWIDAETGYLPDILTLPLLWLGLLVNLGGTFTPLSYAVVGAVAGYLVLWCTNGLFFLLRRRHGLGHGDFKLLAALGAWVGWTALPQILLVAASLALVVALVLRLRGRLAAGAAISFGPYLAIAGLLVLIRL